jgi:hypothetical protein
METDWVFPLLEWLRTNQGGKTDMLNVPRMTRVERRLLVKLGRKIGDPATALRSLAVARLAAGKTSPHVSEELDLARSCVVAIAHRIVAQHSGVSRGVRESPVPSEALGRTATQPREISPPGSRRSEPMKSLLWIQDR